MDLRDLETKYETAKGTWYTTIANAPNIKAQADSSIGCLLRFKGTSERELALKVFQEPPLPSIKEIKGAIEQWLDSDEVSGEIALNN